MEARDLKNLHTLKRENRDRKSSCCVAAPLGSGEQLKGLSEGHLDALHWFNGQVSVTTGEVSLVTCARRP
jgi:hypothetical protein